MSESERELLDYLEDIATACDLASAFVKGLDFERFSTDIKTQFAVVRALEIVGEATKHVPADYRQTHPQLPWRLMAAMRDKLIHDYYETNPRQVWETAAVEAPLVAEQIRAILNQV